MVNENLSDISEDISEDIVHELCIQWKEILIG
jgi:hypothetical protein